MACGPCERARKLLPKPFADGLRGLESNLEQRRQKRLRAALAASAAVPPNAKPPCEHGVPRDEPCEHCRTALLTQSARARDRE